MSILTSLREGRTGGEFFSGVYTFWIRPSNEVFVQVQTRDALRHPVFFCGFGINGSFVDQEIAALQELAQGFRYLYQGRLFRTLVCVN